MFYEHDPYVEIVVILRVNVECNEGFNKLITNLENFGYERQRIRSTCRNSIFLLSNLGLCLNVLLTVIIQGSNANINKTVYRGRP